MPLVFVHGVATRQTPDYRARVYQRDALFKRLVLPTNAVFDPDWGSRAVTFNVNMPWLPEPGKFEALSIGARAPAPESISSLAARKTELAIDLSFAAALAAQAANAGNRADSSIALTNSQLSDFADAVNYLSRDQGPDRSAFTSGGSDSDFLAALKSEIHPSKDSSMALGADALNWMSDGLSHLVNPIRNMTSDLVLRTIRRPLTEQVVLFLGDVFVYLRWRDAQLVADAPHPIFEPIIADLAAAARLRTEEDPLIVVGHSLGGVILYDILSGESTLAEIEHRAQTALHIDALVTVGSQPGLFADMGLFGPAPPAGGSRPCPPAVRDWLNIFDYTDLLSFNCSSMFKPVEDFVFDSITGLFSAHTAYFQRPSFYQRLCTRLRKRGVIH